MVEAEQGMFGEMFLQDGSCEVNTVKYQIGAHVLQIQCLSSENKRQISCESRVIWLASVALANWLSLEENRFYLRNCRSVVELGTGTGLLGIFSAKEAPHANFTLTDLER